MKVLAGMIVIFWFSLSSCSSQKAMVDQTLFEIGNASCQAWLGGRAESGSGMLLEIPILGENLDQINWQQAFFRGKVADIDMESTANGGIVKANFKNQGMKKPDMVMHSDSKQEVGNQPPKLKEKFPFELEKNQGVLSFLEDGTLKYYKVENIKEKKTKMFR
ncbi:MAG: hypothetical protein ACFB0A_06865 [Croceivirga sp.]